MDKKIKDKMMNDAGKAYLVQYDQMRKTADRLAGLSNELDSLGDINDDNLDNLDILIVQANNMLNGKNVDLTDVENNSNNRKDFLVPLFEDLEMIEVVDDGHWNSYMENIGRYVDTNGVDLSQDPFEALLTEQERQNIARRVNEDYTMQKANCDKYDYMIAALCGAISGLIDVFFVDMPEGSKLGDWTDKKVDEFVVKIAEVKSGKSFAGDNKIAQALAYLESQYKVNYDQNTGKAAGELLGMSMSNHHIKSLGHAPDLIGLIFSVLNQFTSTSHFLDNGRLITFDTDYYELRGNNFIAKLFSGIANWLGHLISDVAGSSTSRGNVNGGRGSGIPMPLFELFQLIGKGSFKVYTNNDQTREATEMSFADLSVKVFEQGYDARFGLAQAIPVLVNELSIRLFWSLKRHYYHKKPWKESIPIGNQPELRRMLLTGHGVLCLVDGIDAAARSGGQILLFFLRINFPAWKRLAFSGMLEVRAIYKENVIDLHSLEKDLDMEWKVLYAESSVRL